MNAWWSAAIGAAPGITAVVWLALSIRTNRHAIMHLEERVHALERRHPWGKTRHDAPD